MENKKQLSTVEILRGIACMMVVVFHFSTQQSYYGYYLSETNWLRIVGQYGWLGVQIFFVISGFILPFSLEKSSYKINNFFTFLKKRWWRLWPAYFVSLLLVLLHSMCHRWMWGESYHMEWMNFFLHLFYAPTFFGFEWYNILYWTLGIEFQFYIVVGLLFPLLIHSYKWVRILALLFFACLYFVFPDNRLLTSQSSLFVFGILAFLYYTKRVLLVEFIGLMLLNTILLFYQYANDQWLVAAVTIGATLVMLYARLDFFIGKEIGKISYSLYLIHGMLAINILMLSMRIPFVKEWEWVRTILVILSIGVSIACAYCYWYFIENPSRKKSAQIQY